MTATARSAFRILTRVRGGYGDGTLYDVQLQSLASGSLLWARTFSDAGGAQEFETRVLADLGELDEAAFRRKYGVPATA